MDLFRSARRERGIRLDYFYENTGLDVDAVGFLREVKVRIDFLVGFGRTAL